MELEPRTLGRGERVLLLVIIAFGLLSALYFADFWFFSQARREPAYFALLSFAVFWGVYRSLVNWYVYFFVTPPPPRQATRSYTIDVLTTAMPGEPFAMFEQTLTAICRLQGLGRCFLLDGGNDSELQALCRRLGVEHVDCTHVGGAKAGKINHCLATGSNAELVLVLDPDHRPRPDLLVRAMPWFDDTKIGFVQVVQAYYNLGASFVARAAAEQTFGFYGPIQLGLNGLGIPTAIGANCIFRRSALDSIGGHAVHLAEDALTSMRLHALGWRSVYLPYRGSEGLVPEDLGAFFKQQFKWSNGMFQLLFREYPKLFRRFDATSRLHYFFAGTFYFNALATFLTLVLPIWFLFLRVFAVEFELVEFVLHLAPYVMAIVLSYAFVQRWFTHRSERGIPWRSLVLEKGTWHVYLMGLVAFVLGLRVAYLPTPKGANRARSLGLVLPHLVVIALSLAAISYALLSYPRLDDGTLLMIFFASSNVILLAPVTLVALVPRWNFGGSRGAA